MKVVIVGNGLAGTMAAKTLRELDASVDIDTPADLAKLERSGIRRFSRKPP